LEAIEGDLMISDLETRIEKLEKAVRLRKMRGIIVVGGCWALMVFAVVYSNVTLGP
jgi:predicted metal-binding membrane protein